MSFQTGVNYLEWAKLNTLTRGYLNLSASGMAHILTDEDFAAFTTPPRVLPPPDHPAEWGYHPLKQILADRFSVSPSLIMPTLGTSQANFLLMAALIKPGDRVLVETPVYEPLWQVPQSLGAEISWLPRNPDNHWHFDLEDLEEEMRKGVRLVVLSDPHNPSGISMPAERRRQIADLAERYRTHVLIDTVYALFDWDHWDRAIIGGNAWIGHTMSLTKAYALNNLRAGWAIASPDWLEKAGRTWTLMDVFPPLPHQHLIWQILDHPTLLADIASRAAQRLQNNRVTLLSCLQKSPRVEFTLPETGAIVFVKLTCWSDSTPFTQHLMEERNILVPDGIFFNHRGWVRIGFGTPEADFQHACDRFFSEYNSAVCNGGE